MSFFLFWQRNSSQWRQMDTFNAINFKLNNLFNFFWFYFYSETLIQSFIYKIGVSMINIFKCKTCICSAVDFSRMTIIRSFFFWQKKCIITILFFVILLIFNYNKIDVVWSWCCYLLFILWLLHCTNSIGIGIRINSSWCRVARANYNLSLFQIGTPRKINIPKNCNSLSQKHLIVQWNYTEIENLHPRP